jgi:hypothetical protein
MTAVVAKTTFLPETTMRWIDLRLMPRTIP